MGWLNDKAIEFTSAVNSRIYMDHYGDTKNRPVSGTKEEVMVETGMSIVAFANGENDAAKHHFDRAIESSKKSIGKV